MMYPIAILAFSIFLPSSILCGTNRIENNAIIADNLFPSSLTKLNSSHELPKNGIVKREIYTESDDIPSYSFYNIPSEIVSKRSATGLNKFIYVLRNSFDKSVPVSLENEALSKESENFSGDVTRALTRGTSLDRGLDRNFPQAAFVERRTGQSQPKGRYLRCYFNAVSCFKKRK